MQRQQFRHWCVGFIVDKLTKLQRDCYLRAGHVSNRDYRVFRLKVAIARDSFWSIGTSRAAAARRNLIASHEGRTLCCASRPCKGFEGQT